MELKFSGRRALVLGGNCQMGLALAEAMIQAGLRPVLSHRSDAGRGQISERLERFGDGFDCVHLDLGDAQSVDHLAGEPCSGVDYLVDLAHGELENLVASADHATVRGYFDSQVGVRAMIVQQVSRQMLLKKFGRMVFVSSTAAGRPNAGQGFYAAAKRAAEALYLNVGLELAVRGITTVTLRPGYVDAGRGRRYLQGAGTRVLAQVPTGRAVQLQEVVETIMFLLSDSASGFNATVMTLDGGMSATK